MTWKQLIADLTDFETRLRAALRELKIETATKALVIDHACVRVTQEATATALLSEVSTFGEVISTEIIGGRLIHIVELHEALALLGRKVRGIEIPYPKPDQTYSEGWEHIEFVLPAGTRNTPEGIEAAFRDLFPRLPKAEMETSYAYKLSEPKTEGDQLPNPTIGLKVGDVGLKFHAFPIQKVVGFTQ